MITDLKHLTDRLYAQLHEEILTISARENEVIKRAYQCRQAAAAIWESLKIQVQQLTFKDIAHEVHFYKYGVPQILEELCYWQEMYSLENMVMAMGRKERKNFLNKKQMLVRMDIECYQFVMNYALHDDSYLDERLFVLGNKMKLEDIDFAGAMDGICCLASWQLARGRALLSIKQHIDLILLHKTVADKSDTSKPKAPLLQWTGTKAQFIELIYALQASGCINHAQLDIKQLFEVISATFSIQVTNYYSYLNAIALRKKDLTPFLKTLEMNLTRQIQDRNAWEP